jgi:hypothetical protein
MLEQNIINAYSLVQDHVTYTNNNDVSFNGTQRQSEFFKAWNYISEYYSEKKPKTLKFLEVGAYRGLWGIAFVEFCKLNNIKGEYVTITLMDHDPNNRPLYNTLSYVTSEGFKSHLIDLNTFDQKALSKVQEYSKHYDIVFIDAGHKYDEAKNDIDKFASLATDLLLFHDIRPIEATNNCGVYQAIQDSNLKLDIEISVIESEMGIGIKYIK